MDAAVKNTKSRSVKHKGPKLRKTRAKQNIFVRFFTDTRSNRSVAGNVLLIIFIAAMAFLFFLPILMMISNAFKPLNELLKFPPDILVHTPTWNNFRDLGVIFRNSLVPFSRYLFNTLFIVVAGTIGQMAFAAMAAFPLAKFHFWGNRFISELIVLSLMFSASVTSVPNYVIMSKLQLIDSYWAILLPAFCGTFGLYLLRNFMSSVPNSLIESAQLDGAGEMRILWFIIIPAVKPALITMFILSFQQMWGSTGGSFIYNESLKTLAFALTQVGGTIARQGVMAAVSLIMFIIPITFYIVSQTQVLETMTTSGMKE